MNNVDKKYLKLQFWLKIHEKNFTEFQSFFESVMGEAFPDFQKIRPYGKKGDEGNDGYRPGQGEYYQVYAPKDPKEKEAVAAKKLKEDFEKLKKTWDRIEKIKTFHFVFNDKNFGVTVELEKVLADLRTANPEISFKLFLPRHLEEIFFTLKEESIQSLGFDLDSRNALKICVEALYNLEVYIDRGNASFVLESLKNLKDIVFGQKDEGLILDWEILECRALQQLEKIKEVEEKYRNLCKRFPKDPRAFLYLAEIRLQYEDFDQADELLKEAEKIDSNHWLLRLEKSIRDRILKKKVDISSIDENNFPPDFRIKSTYYRIYSQDFLEEDFVTAEAFIERAISLNPDRLSNYVVKLGQLERKAFSQFEDINKGRKVIESFLKEVDVIQDKVTEWGKLSPRNQVTFNLVKFNLFHAVENHKEAEKLAEESVNLILQCDFDINIDHNLGVVLAFIQIPRVDLDKLLVYLRAAEKSISDHLTKVLFFQFYLKKTLFSEGRKFFEDKRKEGILGFIGNLENKDYEEAWNFMKDDYQFAITFANSFKELPELRRKIIENLPDDGNIQKDKLLLLLNYDESSIDEAFDILKKLDLSESRYFECKLILEIAQKKKAWDFVIIVAQKLLQYEKDKNDILQLELVLFDANLNLERLPKAIEIGEKILANKEELGMLNEKNRESLLSQTILARLKRGEYPEAKVLVELYSDIPKTFEFKAGVEAEVYLKNNDALKAIEAIVSGVKIIKTPTQEQYSKLFLALTEIDHLIHFSLDSLQGFKKESFVKFKNEERWYFIGDGEELDAIKISSSDERFNKFLDKKIADKVIFDFKYRPSSEYIIESILPIDKYIFWKAARYFNKLAAEGNLEGVYNVEVPKRGDTIDTKNIIGFLEDERRGRKEFFDLYCSGNVPLAFLAISEGDLTSAIGQIQNEGRGFIRFSSGDPGEIKRQKEVAKKIIAGNPFYIDGTSALMLSETDLLAELYSYLPNLKVPQSVIAMLFKIKKRFRYTPGQAGHLQYVQGQLRFSSVKPDEGEALQKRFENSLKALESKPENLAAISPATKTECLAEQKVPAELNDACVMAQKEEVVILTEDYLYLQANMQETGKKVPEYCSSFALMSVLYEQKKISFEKYLSYFSYLSGYRFRFLPITIDDIWKAVFGDGIITLVQPERIRWLNFPLTLSEEYGVSFSTSFGVVGIFLMRVLTDDAILPEIAERIFLEILSGFPTNKDKRFLGKLFLTACDREIKKVHGTIGTSATTRKKIEQLSQIARIYTGGENLWTPPIPRST